jgi:hypothetical protein
MQGVQQCAVFAVVNLVSGRIYDNVLQYPLLIDYTNNNEYKDQ